MQVDVVTLFPEMFDGPMNASMMHKARERGLLELHLHQLRDYATDNHRTVDDTPYGGGGGMILKPDVLVRAVEAIIENGSREPPVILLSPQGRLFSHRIALELAQHERLLLLCGHYEGVDERVRELVVTDEISIGDYVLTGGELAAMVVIDAVLRHVPGLLGAEGAAARDSHADDLLEGPHYTRPATFRGLTVPEVLQQGDHTGIAVWRREQSLRRTWRNRPELLLRARLSDDDRYLLATFADEDTA